MENSNVLIVGGDERYLQVIKQLLAKGANISLIGYSKIKDKQINVNYVECNQVNFENMDVIILPVSGVSESGEVVATYANESVVLTDEMFQRTAKHCVIYTGILTPFLKDITEKIDREIICIFDRDDLAILNSIPTSEGALQIALENTNYTIHSSNVFILGFGRIGMTISRLFSNVGANVAVAVRNPSDLARIIEMNMQPIQITDLSKEIEEADIVINTVQYPILDSKIISMMKQESIIIDLASDPGGTDFAFAEEFGIKAIHALGLPGKVAPKTAGKVIANVLIDLMSKSSFN